MKRIFTIAVITIGLTGCQQPQQNLSAAGQKMQAAMKECSAEALTRKNAVEQADCIGDAKRQAASETNNPYTDIVERDIAADHKSAIQYAAGKISQEAYITALDKHWAEALKADDEARAHSHQREERDQQIQDAFDSAGPGIKMCQDKRHTGIFKTYVESWKCSTPYITAAFEHAKFPYMELVQQYTDKRLAILKRLDKKKITVPQSLKEMHEAMAHLKAQAHERDLKSTVPLSLNAS